MEEAVQSFHRKLANAEIIVGIIGLGYVGLPLAKAFWKAGLRVVGFDVDSEKVEMLNSGRSYLKHLGEQFVQDMGASDRFHATGQMSELADVDAILICVPTPLGKHFEPDLSYVENTADMIAENLRPNQLVVLESTTYPRTTREVVLPRLEARGFKCGTDLFVAFSPEREDPGRKDYQTATIPKLVGGIDSVSGKLAVALYKLAVIEVISVSTAEVAEAAKILENVYRAVNIALANEMKVILSRMGIDVWEVIEAAKTKPFGFQAFYPGPGLGGHCIPIDPYYLTWKAREVGLPTRFIELAGEINHFMPEYVIRETISAMNDAGRCIRGSRILLLGLAYKPNIDDVRESPSFELITRLLELGATVDYNDPHVPSTHSMRHYPELPALKSVELTPESLGGYDCVLVATDHALYDWQLIADSSKLIIDTRNALVHVNGRRDHIVKA